MCRVRLLRWFRATPGQFRGYAEDFLRSVRSLLKLTVCHCSARFQRSQRNPSVGYDTERKKFAVMVVENGVNAPKGSFRAEEEAVEVCTPSAKLTGRA